MAVRASLPNIFLRQGNAGCGMTVCLQASSRDRPVAAKPNGRRNAIGPRESSTALTGTGDGTGATMGVNASANRTTNVANRDNDRRYRPFLYRLLQDKGFHSQNRPASDSLADLSHETSTGA